jgi:hypothetical protein
VSRIRPQVTGPDLAGPAALLDELINVLAWGLGEGSGMKPYDAMNDDERTEVAGEAVRHLSHEIETWRNSAAGSGSRWRSLRRRSRTPLVSPGWRLKVHRSTSSCCSPLLSARGSRWRESGP